MNQRTIIHDLQGVFSHKDPCLSREVIIKKTADSFMVFDSKKITLSEPLDLTDDASAGRNTCRCRMMTCRSSGSEEAWGSEDDRCMFFWLAHASLKATLAECWWKKMFCNAIWLI